MVRMLLFALLCWSCLGCSAGAQADTTTPPDFINFLLEPQLEDKEKILAEIESTWQTGYAFALADLLRLSNDGWTFNKITALLEKKSNQVLDDYDDVLKWIWTLEPDYVPSYADFKGELYQYIDPKFKKYFQGRQEQRKIRLDEVVWGGVVQDGIPPLRIPSMISAEEADYLEDDHVVFGISINGEAKAYPKRILAWHEFFDDYIGGERIAGVYCTLCGTVIGYKVEQDTVTYDLGTSGFLYRSNKLMYDKKTQSLWNTLEGRPVLGPLAGKGIELDIHPIVTTTWGEWKRAHPDTKVLSLDTGHKRNYDEGAAYASYFGTDELMFPVPNLDERLLNKDEVLIVRTPGYQTDPLAVSIKRLRRRGLHQDKIGEQKVVMLARANGAARAYEAGNVIFDSYRKGELRDKHGRIWDVTEDALIGPDREILKRLPSHNSFWFAWYSMHPKTRLVR